MQGRGTLSILLNLLLGSNAARRKGRKALQQFFPCRPRFGVAAPSFDVQHCSLRNRFAVLFVFFFGKVNINYLIDYAGSLSFLLGFTESGTLLIGEALE
uniref:Putative secreted protein n=1 Tax=Anopheles darlingi TaxID=43151 RepID=A0A2M4DBX0_ANODA